MALLFWDASALVKRYFKELGSDTVNTIFSLSAQHEVATTPWSYLETASILLRRLNGGVLDAATYTTATSALQSEVVANPDFGMLSIQDAFVFGSVSLLRKHNLNATDSAFLATLLDHLHTLGRRGCLLVASDKRLLRAAHAEGLRTLNPEEVDPADVPGLLAPP